MRQNSGVTWKAVIIALILLPPNCYWSIRRGIMWSSAPDTLSLLYNAVFTLFFLSLFNLLFLKRFFKKFALTQAELLAIYIMVSLATVIGGFDCIQTVSEVIAHVFYFATSENEWKEIFSPYLPKWLMVTDEKALIGFYETVSTFYVAEYIKAWLIPTIVWSLFLSIVVFIMLCINVLLRKQWTEVEKLTYPIIQIPLVMTEDGGAKAFFTNKGFWLAFAAAAGVDVINTLSLLFPVVPGLPTRGLGFYFAQKPWNAMGWIALDFMPFSFAFAFFLPLDLNFSCWFFYLLWLALKVLLSIIGVKSTSSYLPYAYQQVAAGGIALGIIAVWKTRRHLLNTITIAFPFERLNDSTISRKAMTSESIQYRTALGGIVGGMSLLVLFFYKTGMPIWVAIAFLSIYFLTSIAITRMRAELGAPFHEFVNCGADQTLVSVFGSRRLGNSALAMFIPLSGITSRQRGNPMPHQLEGFKMAERTGMDSKKLFLVMIFSLVFGAFLSFFLILHSTYKYGTNLLGFGYWAITPVKNWMINPTSPNFPDISAMSFGFSFTLFLSFMRRFLWWPLHPLAYPLSLVDWGMKKMWFVFMMTWAIKKTLLKYGGARLYHRAVPIFSGLLLGEFIVGGLLTIINFTFNIPVYIFWPG